MDVLGQQFGGHHDAAGEHGPEEEAEEGDGDGRDDELRDEPEDQLQRQAAGQVDGDAEPLAEALRHEAQTGAPQCHARPESRARVSRGGARGGADSEHECHDPAAQANLRTGKLAIGAGETAKEDRGELTFDAHVDEEKRRAEPGDLGLEGFFCAAVGAVGFPRVFSAVEFAGLVPEGQAEADELEHRSAHLFRAVRKGSRTEGGGCLP